jgi:hypothetical protein
VPVPWSSDERHVLAALRDELERSDPALASSFGLIRARPSRRWMVWAAAAVTLVVAVGWLVDIRAVWVALFLAVLGSPLLVAWAPPPEAGPVSPGDPPGTT